MHATVSRVSVMVGALALAGMTAVLVAQCNRAEPNQDVLTQLLVELRGLRATMEQMASAGPRVQLALGRLQLQEQRIATMNQRLDSVRDSMRVAAATRGTPPALKAEEASLQQQIAAEQGRWSDINQRLEELERTLDRR
jgi:predicted  nucleic acid-binding Zn-ribbon protein